MPAIPADSLEIFGKGVPRSEGVVIDRDGFVFGGGRNGVMYRVSPDDVVEEIATLPAGSTPNGLAMDRNGDLIVCDLGSRPGVIRVSQAGQVSQIAEEVGGLRLKTPNFATYGADGSLYVTNTVDASLAERAGNPLLLHDPNATGALVRIRPNGKGDVVAPELHFANGTAIDPQEEAIYVLQTIRRNVLRIPLRGGRPEVYSEDFPGCPDGMAFAADGSLIVTLPGDLVSKEEAVAPTKWMRTASKLIRIDTGGAWSLLVDDPQTARLNFPTNCAFGGPGLRQLYVANLEADHFSRVTLEIAGRPLYHQQ